MATENFWLFSRLKALRLALEGLRDEIKSQFNLSEGGRWLIFGYQLGVDDPQGQGRQTHYGQSSPERRDGDPGSHRLRRPRLNLDGRRKLHSSRVVALEGHNLAEDEVFDEKRAGTWLRKISTNLNFELVSTKGDNDSNKCHCDAMADQSFLDGLNVSLKLLNTFYSQSFQM